MRLVTLPLAAALLVSNAAQVTATAQTASEVTNIEFVGHVLKPEKQQLKPSDLGQLRRADGFSVSVFADGLVNPRMLAVADDGAVYVTRRTVGDVVMLRDEDGDGRAEVQTTVASRPGMHGIAIDGDDVYLATVKEVFKAKIRDDGTFTTLVRIIDDLPDAGQHPNRTIAVGPDKMLYISVGSTCNACAESNAENATMLRASLDGRKRSIFASGLRNTIGFDWHPKTGELFGMDHNIDWHGDDQPEEELNKLVQGKKYGWPYVLADGFLNPQDEPPGDITVRDWAAASEKPLLTYTAHAAPMQMAFYKGTAFPAEYSGDAFVAMRGSWNRNPPSGYEVVRIAFEDGKPKRIEPFISGFITKEGGTFKQTARLAGLAVAKDGTLLVADDENGVVYRIAYEGGHARTTAASEIPTPAPQRDDALKALAIDDLDARGLPKLQVMSPALAEGTSIPLRYSDYGGKISPPLSWSGAPEATVSFAIIADDPDAKPKLVNHWTLFNVPTGTTSLREGLPTDPAIPVPQAEQGTNTRGATGYYGPRPPAGEPPHHYHFQVFALDKTLELPPAPSRELVLKAMRGHVLAAGELVGTFQRDADLQKTVDGAKDIFK
jgi:Raf kinase inhibitor-like YbhB/YbcL family protein